MMLPSNIPTGVSEMVWQKVMALESELKYRREVENDLAAEVESLKLSVESYEADHQAAEKYVGELEAEIERLKDESLMMWGMLKGSRKTSAKYKAERDALLALVKESIERGKTTPTLAAHLDYISRASAAIANVED